MDGNNSLKRIARANLVDRRQFRSDYRIPRDEVDRFAKDDCPKKNQPALTPEEEAVVLLKGGMSCGERWAAANEQKQGKINPMFDEMGIFAAACRHGLILWYTDMVQSGEL